MLTNWAPLAADFFEGYLGQRKNDPEVNVGITGGDTLFEFVSALPARPRPDVRICSAAIVGRGNGINMLQHIDPMVNATLLWAKCGRPGFCCYATAAPYDGSVKDMKQLQAEMKSLAKREAIRETLRRMEAIDIAFVGLGVVKQTVVDRDSLKDREHLYKVSMMHLLPPKVAKEAVDRGAVGEIGYCLFDKEGNGKREWELFLTPGSRVQDAEGGVAFYKALVRDERKRVVVIAGSGKEEPLKAALRGELFNVWITDRNTAEESLKWKNPDLHPANRK